MYVNPLKKDRVKKQMKKTLDLLELKYYNNIVELKKWGDEVSPRTGRPKAENPKSTDIKVRIDDETSKRLDEYCKAHSITRAEAIRRGIHLLLTQK